MSKILKTLRKSAPRVGLLMIVLAIVAAEVAPQALAINNYGPDGNDFSAFDRVFMVVSQGGGSSLDAPYSKVYAYAPVGAGGSQTIRLTLVGGDHCYDGNGGALGVDSSAPFQTAGSDTAFKFSTPTGTVINHNNTVRFTPDSTSPSGCNTDQQDFYVPVNDGDRPSQGSGLHGYYKIAVEASMNNNGVNAFKVILPNGGVMSYTDSSGDKFALQQRVDRNWIRSDFNVYFATPCDSSDTVTAQLKWYDADQGQFGQTTSTFGYRLYQRTRGTSGGWVQIHQNTSVGGEAVPGDAWYDFQKNQEYRWEWYGVSPQNGIQFQVPFDSAYAAVACEGSDFNLTPTISTTPENVGPGTDNISVTATVQKTGTTSSFTDEEWRITRFIVPPGSNLVQGGGPNVPCSQFSGQSQCNQVWGGTNVTFTATNTVLAAGWLDSVDHSLTPGTRICYVTSVSKGSSASPTWKHTSPDCSTIVQTPLAYILGNDLRVGSGFQTSPNFVATANRTSRIGSYVTTLGGSWVEYGILSPGSVTGVASQSGAVNGASPNAQNTWSRLTFANRSTPSGCAPAYGCYADADSMGKLPNVDRVLSDATLTGVQRRTIGGNQSISTAINDGGLLDLNNFRTTMVLIMTGSGTLTIDRNIRYTTGVLTDGTQLPQLVIIAPNINIAGNVTQIDAWLVTDGTLNTCSDVAQSQLRTTNCNQSLRINGPIMANQTLLNRTYFDTTRANAAEEINLRGDAYIWANNLSRENATWQTTYTTDLPPRY